MFVTGLVLGMYIGVFFGLLIAGLCAAAARGAGEWNDRRAGAQQGASAAGVPTAARRVHARLRASARS
jgi:hypothetical protein